MAIDPDRLRRMFGEPQALRDAMTDHTPSMPELMTTFGASIVGMISIVRCDDFAVAHLANLRDDETTPKETRSCLASMIDALNRNRSETIIRLRSQFESFRIVLDGLGIASTLAQVCFQVRDHAMIAYVFLALHWNEIATAQVDQSIVDAEVAAMREWLSR